MFYYFFFFQFSSIKVWGWTKLLRVSEISKQTEQIQSVRCQDVLFCEWPCGVRQNSRIQREKRLKGLVRKVTSSNIKENTDSWSIIFGLFAYRITLYVLEFSIQYVKLISSFYCNCDTVMARTTVIPLTFVVSTMDIFRLRLKTRRAKCCFVVLAWLLFYLEKLIKNPLLQGKKGKKNHCKHFYKHWLQCCEVRFLYTGFPFQIVKLT